ncbi:MAG: T9SS type A sorting domain-containing protein [candidate division Zixibacteria bacterium]
MNNSKCLLTPLTLILFLILSPIGHSEVSFTENIIDDDFDAAGLYACDFDGDLDIDVFGAGVNSGIAWWRNDGGYPVTWTRYMIDEDFTGAMSVFAKDVDGDGDIDVLGTSWYDHDIAWWRNDGGDPITWTKYTIDGDFHNAHDVFAEDLDGDGDTDVLGAGPGDNDIAYWRNDGGDPIEWSKFIIDNGCGGARSVFPSDIDGDGDLDVLGACFSTDEINLYRNDGGDPITWTELGITANFNGAHFVMSYDMDGDSDLDVLGAAYMAADITWWRNNGPDPRDWTRQTIDGNFGGALTLYPADFDNDNDIDVAGAGDGNDDIAWWRNDGGDPFEWTEITVDPYFNGAWPVFACDIENDGDSDILAGSNVVNKVVWWENDLVTGVEEESTILPDKAIISNNYPNPFNSSTIIEYNLPVKSEVTINIYDILGRNIETLINREQNAGHHQAVWAADNVSSGIYFYRIQAGNFIASRQMTLLK